MNRTYPTPTAEDLAALQAFANAHGRNWKGELSNVYWYNARCWTGPRGDDEFVGSTLHAIRNNFGPTWLYDRCTIKPEPQRYTLASSPLIHTPGILRWGINGYAFARDRKAILRVFTQGWPTIPAAAFKAILAQQLPVIINDEAGTVEFEWRA